MVARVAVFAVAVALPNPNTDPFFFFFFTPIVILALFFLSLLRVTQMRGHIAGSFFSPLPTAVRAFHFYREKTLAFASLVDSRRI